MDERVASSSIKAFVTTVGILSLATYIFLLRPIHQKSQKNILLRPLFQFVILVSLVKSQSIRVFVLVADHLSFFCFLCLFISENPHKKISIAYIILCVNFDAI